ncbi:hypothetical protein Pmar_PMAR008708 [Perkinsus marinus ATCC 50983]|uniref:Uncharacterized protein n=1 Tax=Perkinsus marinus (strain ATCC 50983 / TXsc) TaxID=423536 RepID=C5L0S7_PERM5|nr:hypothetical protein Pmar_PMAR008708 [Perkinsus marinus ATCC 50983]EER09569.1 hypothetical protein Pmar_PMAR008708 [Perkinsus marinus ATCC 50983]|eukprot:XP_002777774.1 hypothetical protein Pmar_PMAR008708 [Perkinsus marinus ATCC 50983]
MPIPFSAREVSWACSDSSQIHVVFGDSPVVFGSEYLRKQDSKLPDSVFQQWCDDDGDEGDEGLILAGEDDLGIDVYRQVTNFEDIDVNDDGDIVVDGTPSSSGIADGEEFVALCNSPRNKKHLQISGVRSRIISIPLDGWTDLVKQKINDIVASMPRDHVREEFVLQQYDRMILDEINSAMKNEVEAVPLHRISFNDLKAYLSKLRNYETASASTIQGMEALTRLRVSLDGDAIHKPPANPAIIEGAGGPPSPVPKPVITDQLRRQGHGTSVPASAAKPGFSATSSGNGQAKENRKSNMICRWCHIPLSTREFNMYIDDGSRYGRCPCAPLPDTLTEKAKLYAQERVKSLVVEDIRGKGRRCGICMLPMISSIMDMTTGQFLPDHERFYDSEKRSSDLYRGCSWLADLDLVFITAVGVRRIGHSES